MSIYQNQFQGCDYWTKKKAAVSAKRKWDLIKPGSDSEGLNERLLRWILNRIAVELVAWLNVEVRRVRDSGFCLNDSFNIYKLFSKQKEKKNLCSVVEHTHTLHTLCARLIRNSYDLTRRWVSWWQEKETLSALCWIGLVEWAAVNL